MHLNLSLTSPHICQSPGLGLPAPGTGRGKFLSFSSCRAGDGTVLRQPQGPREDQACEGGATRDLGRTVLISLLPQNQDGATPVQTESSGSVMGTLFLPVIPAAEGHRGKGPLLKGKLSL